MPGVPAWSALVMDGVAVPYNEVVSVRMVESALGLIVEQASHGLDDAPLQHLRMYSRAEFNLWREALQPKVESFVDVATVHNFVEVYAIRLVSVKHRSLKERHHISKLGQQTLAPRNSLPLVRVHPLEIHAGLLKVTLGRAK